jgi:hypothetical protein
MDDVQMHAAEVANRDKMPPPKDYVRKLVSLPPALAERVSDYRWRRRLPSETAAIRELIEKALDAADREEQKRAQQDKP